MENKKIKIAVMGFGNVSKGAIDAIQAAPDLEFVGVIEERDHRRADFIKTDPTTSFFKKAEDIEGLEVVVLGIPTRNIKDKAKELLRAGYHTVDSFDIHGEEMVNLRNELAEVGKAAGSVAVVGAGWDPGTDSMVRAVMEIIAPRGITETNFGPGMSMGHSVAVRKMPGIKDALSITIPKGTSLHRRMVYVVLEAGVTLDEVKDQILKDPYFCNDETYIQEVDSVEDLKDWGHGVSLNRKGIAGKTHNQMLSFEARLSNPEVTGQVMVSAARAAAKQAPGAYTFLDIPLGDFLSQDNETLIKRLI